MKMIAVPVKYVYAFFLLTFFLCLTSCSHPDRDVLLRYERSLVQADSLVQGGGVDSVRIVRLLSSLHREYEQAKELSGGKKVRLVPADRWKQFGWLSFSALMIGLNVWFSIRDIHFSRDRKYRRYLVDLSENEQRLRNNGRERAELEECLKEMSLEDDEREEVQRSLTNLLAHGNRLCEENESLSIRLKAYEDRAVPRELELLTKESERARQLDRQVQALTASLIDGDEVVAQLRNHPKFLTDSRWDYLRKLTDRVYEGASTRLVARFPQLTPADLQLCLLMRLRFTNAQIATLTAVSPASVSQQKFRLKKRLMQAEESLFKDGETLDEVVCRV